MILSNIKTVFWGSVCLFQFGLLNSQAQDTEHYSRVGLTIQSGYTFPGNALYSSNFNIKTSSSYNYGAALKFAVMPFWSLETGYRYNTIKGSELSAFETTLQSLTIKNLFNFNRLYQGSELSQLVNVYGIAGFEYDFYEYQSGNTVNEGTGAGFSGGLGVELSLGRAFDLFSQYELKFSSNHIDNIHPGSGFDQIGIASGGIRINFGKDESRPLKHKPRAAMPPETGNRTPEFVNAPEEPQPPQNADSSRAEEIQTIETPLTETEENYVEQIDSLTNRLHRLQEKIDSLQNSAEEISTDTANPAAREAESFAGEGVAYVQVFTGRMHQNAIQVKDRFQAILARELDIPAEKVFIIHKGPFYEVLIGSFSNNTDTQRVLDIATAEFSDSFLVYIEQ